MASALTPIASPLLLAGRKRPRLDQLGDWPLLSPDDPWPQWFERFGGKEPSRYVATFSDTDTMQRATVEGVGVSLGRETLIRPLVQAGRLVVLFPERMKARYAHYLVYPERSRHHKGFQAFREWLHAEAAAFREGKDTGVHAPAPRRSSMWNENALPMIFLPNKPTASASEIAVCK